MRLFPDSRLQDFWKSNGSEAIYAYKCLRENDVMQRTPKKLEKKRLVRYKEGAEMYSMGMNKFQALAKDAGAILKIDRMVLVDLDTFDQYLETFRVRE